MKHSRY